MPPYAWPLDLEESARALGAKTQIAGTYAIWAIWSVDGLAYLDDLDDDVFRGATRSIGAHHVDTVDITHARWAVGTAMTAVDLAAASIGALHLPHRPDRAYDVGELGRPKNQSQLCSGCAAWLSDVVDDPDFATLTALRHPFTHRSLPRHIHVHVGASPAAGRKIRPWTRPTMVLTAASAG
ncbi:hypothetical protein Afe04nite_56640 [Asanoa ferruginea]|nr:hypothetical protein Afe04nite_56640 [Asanoa ferruginea]